MSTKNVNPKTGPGSVYTVATLAVEIGMCERSVREALRKNKIPSIKVGKRFIIPKAAIAEWLRTAGGSVRADVRPAA